jgi:hypothetical protein
MSDRRRRLWQLAAAFVGGGLLLPWLVGCQGALVGDWHLREAVPNRQVFSIDRASFRSDGTYSATTTIEGVTTSEDGTYEFDGFRLKLRPRAGGQRTYTASLKLDRLEIGDAKRHAVLQKGAKGK